MPYPAVSEVWQMCATCLLPDDAWDEMFHTYIEARYCEPQRHYHTMQHLESMCAELAQYRRTREHAWAMQGRSTSTQKGRPRPRQQQHHQHGVADSGTSAYAEEDDLVLGLTILFHDSVYDPQARDNEEQSVAWMQRFMRHAHERSASISKTLPAPTLPSSATSIMSNTALAASASYVSEKQQHDGLLWHKHASVGAAVEHRVGEYILHSSDHLAVSPRRMWPRPLRPCSTTTSDESRLHSYVDSAYELFFSATRYDVPPIASNGTSGSDHNDGSDRDNMSVTQQIFPVNDPDDDLHVFLDLDLAILGSGWKRYVDYTTCVRAEYRHLSERQFCAGRADFLEGLLKHSQWYKTAYFFYRFEEQARRNVRKELRELHDRLEALRKLDTKEEAAAS